MLRLGWELLHIQTKQKAAHHMIEAPIRYVDVAKPNYDQDKLQSLDYTSASLIHLKSQVPSCVPKYPRQLNYKLVPGCNHYCVLLLVGLSCLPMSASFPVCFYFCLHDPWAKILKCQFLKAQVYNVNKLVLRCNWPPLVRFVCSSLPGISHFSPLAKLPSLKSWAKIPMYH